VIFLLDTNAVSDLMFGHAKPLARLGALSSADEVITCTIVVGEIQHGIQSLAPGAKRRDLEQKFQHVGQWIAGHALPVAAADHYAQLRIECRHRGISLSENDFWIAATAFAAGAVLVTRDRDFSQITSLRVEDWTV
jgi:predicted nucleic acid-binding protein